jgi:hypothetical protein
VTNSAVCSKIADRNVVAMLDSELQLRRVHRLGAAESIPQHYRSDDRELKTPRVSYSRNFLLTAIRRIQVVCPSMSTRCPRCSTRIGVVFWEWVLIVGCLS